MSSRKDQISDTITVTANGNVIVDVPKLLSKPHIQETIRKIRAKTRVVPKRPRPAILVPAPEQQ